MTKLEFIDKINDILIGLNTAESDALGSLYDELMRDAGWHPASELPKLKDGEDDVEFIVILDGYDIRLPFHATYCKYTGWSHDKVKWWIAPPGNDK